MKASELRIGNYINEVEDGLIIVNSIDSREHRFYVTDQNGDINGEDFIEPIPLTEEWLERFGFEYSDLNGDSGLWKIPPFQIYGKYNQFLYDYRLDVNYVHQLQNLYFALTGEELTIKKIDNK
jgi:hypothetical protein